MTIYRANIKSILYVEADSMRNAHRQVEYATRDLPCEVSIKATKMLPVDLDQPQTKG